MCRELGLLEVNRPGMLVHCDEFLRILLKI